MKFTEELASGIKEHRRVIPLTNPHHGGIGCFICTDLYDGKPYSCEDFVVRSGLTPEGKYIGDVRISRHLILQFGIMPEVAKRTHNVCSVGLSAKDGKWYGWSHRAISGFRTRREAVRFARSVS